MQQAGDAGSQVRAGCQPWRRVGGRRSVGRLAGWRRRRQLYGLIVHHRPDRAQPGGRSRPDCACCAACTAACAAGRGRVPRAAHQAGRPGGASGVDSQWQAHHVCGLRHLLPRHPGSQASRGGRALLATGGSAAAGQRGAAARGAASLRASIDGLQPPHGSWLICSPHHHSPPPPPTRPHTRVCPLPSDPLQADCGGDGEPPGGV
jgi:hypothetical protein